MLKVVKIVLLILSSIIIICISVPSIILGAMWAIIHNSFMKGFDGVGQFVDWMTQK